MRGQEFTVMNYLVWAAFAAAFFVVVYSAAHAVASRGCTLGERDLYEIIKSASLRSSGCVGTKGRVVICPNTSLSVDLVKTVTGWSKTVYICGGTGTIVSPSSKTILVTRAISATIRACVDGDNFVVCINYANCDSGVSNSAACVGG